MNCMNFLFYPKQKINIDDTNSINSSTNSINSSTNSINSTTNSTTNIIKIKDTIPFSIKITEGYVVSISNKYSILIASKLPFVDSPLYRFIINFNGITTPDNYNIFNQKNIGELLKTELTNILLHEVVILKKI